VETLARAIHEDYVRRQRSRATYAEGEPSLLPWDLLPESLKRSNRNQAIFIDTKLDVVGCDVVVVPAHEHPVLELEDVEIERLARMEHERWVAERLGDGWTPGPERDLINKRTPYLVAWEELSEAARDLDRDTVREIPRFLADAGLGIVRRAGEPDSAAGDMSLDFSKLAQVAQVLSEAGCVAATEEARELMEAAAGDPSMLDALLDRRTKGEPLAWLTGSVNFCGTKLFVDQGVYVPRWQTEPLAMRAASLLPSRGVAVDLCTGAGAIAATLSRAEPSAEVLATELDERALRCARRNGVSVFEGFLDDPLPREYEHRVDVMTAVVPYVPTESLHLLPRDVQAFEPRSALDGGPGGTKFLAEVALRSPRWLSPGGWLLLELGGEQVEIIGKLLGELGFEELDVMADEDGDPRAMCARLANPTRTGRLG
jgi:release factor glutamine methyltransferase